MPVSAGGFVWYELTTSDAAAAQEFYTKVVGWNAADAGMPGVRYTLLKVGERPVAGLMDIPPGAQGWPLSWMGHILTDDVDAMAARVKQAGGAVHRPSTDIPGVGRFAVVSDLQGAGFLLFKGNGAPAPDLAPGTPGTVGWHELHARDWQAAFAFYQDLFGWEKAQAVDMGAMGTYQTFAVSGAWAGGIMNDPQAAAPFWLYYVNVASITAAAARIVDAGGKVLQGPHEVPGGSWTLTATDPQGAMFALVGPRD